MTLPRMRVSTEFHYDSAHFLPNVPEGHKCGRMHGHTYRLKVTADGPFNSDMSGWVVDFAHVKKIVNPHVDLLDHRLLNDIPGLENPTVEVQLGWLWRRISGWMPAGVGLTELELWEGLNNSATYNGYGATPTDGVLRQSVER